MMAEKGFNTSDECSIRCVHLPSREEEGNSSLKDSKGANLNAKHIASIFEWKVICQTFKSI